MALSLPEQLAEKADTFGDTRVALVLKSGRKVHDVTLAPGGGIVKIDGEAMEKERLTFGMTDIIDVLPAR